MIFSKKNQDTFWELIHLKWGLFLESKSGIWYSLNHKTNAQRYRLITFTGMQGVPDISFEPAGK
jgi:hypothetical protein